MGVQRAYTAAEIEAAERPLLAAGVPLMQRAAAGLAAEVGRELAARGAPVGGARVLLLVGAGNNGGDTLFAGALLATAGAAVRAVLTSGRCHEQGRAAALAAGVRFVGAADGSVDSGRADVAGLASGSDAVLDGVLGIASGAAPVLRGRAREVVAAVRDELAAAGGAGASGEAGGRRAAVVAVDTPSGVATDDGAVADGVVLAADVTVTFGACKRGLLLEPGASSAGRVVVVDIGLGLA